MNYRLPLIAVMFVPFLVQLAAAADESKPKGETEKVIQSVYSAQKDMVVEAAVEQKNAGLQLQGMQRDQRVNFNTQVEVNDQRISIGRFQDDYDNFIAVSVWNTTTGRGDLYSLHLDKGTLNVALSFPFGAGWKSLQPGTSEWQKAVDTMIEQVGVVIQAKMEEFLKAKKEGEDTGLLKSLRKELRELGKIREILKRQLPRKIAA